VSCFRIVLDAIHVLTAADTVGSLIHETEAQCLKRYAALVDRVAVEIGTFRGGSAAVITSSLAKGATLISIDPYVRDSMVPSLRGSLLLAWLNVLRHGRIRQVSFIRGYSHEVVRTWKRPIDLLWIDGSHKYEDAKRDFLDWSGYVVKNGYLIFHDSNRINMSDDQEFDNGWVGPTKVCLEIKERMKHEYEHVESVRSINIFRKLIPPVQTGMRHS